MGLINALNAVIPPIGYQPPAGYELDIEVFPASALISRASTAHLRTPSRIEFHQLICINEGRCTHMADFEKIPCRPGSVIIMRPGQVQRFDEKARWGGWLVLFRPEFYLPKTEFNNRSQSHALLQLEELPAHLALNKAEREAVEESITRMFRDAQLHTGQETVKALLRTELHALLIRLQLAHEQRQMPHHATFALFERFRQYRLAVERGLHQHHQVGDYAKLLGWSEKSIGRATLEVAGVTAKRYLSQCITLEAKRLLAHTDVPISAISDKLGFDEATNFIKFFRRETGLVPGEFRKQSVVQYS